MNPVTLEKTSQFFVGGGWVDPATDETIAVVNATTEEVMGSVPAGTASDVDTAVAAANAAAAPWRELSPNDRAAICTGIGARLQDRAEEIASLISQELGSPLQQALMIQAGLPAITFMSMEHLVEHLPWEETIGNSLVVREPVGTVGAITPWNYPLHQIAAKAAPAMTAGCTIVVKPSEVAPLSAFILAEIMEEVGVPPGVFNLVTGTGPVVGEAIVTHEGIDVVSFTGSTVAGRRVSELAAASVKPVTLELGGKSANVILDDADLETAVVDGIQKCFINSGQTCSALTRMLVPRDSLPKVEAIVQAAINEVKVGDPTDPETTLGPLVSDIQRERVRNMIDAAVDEGARLVCGGSEPPEGLDTGYFVKPTVFSEVTPEMTIAQEEVFGPVLVIMACEDEEDAINLANATRYGLAGGVWSADEERAKRVARRMDTGQVEINGGVFNPLAPFGGRKMSGHGRELGPYGIDDFLSLKSMQM